GPRRGVPADHGRVLRPGGRPGRHRHPEAPRPGRLARDLLIRRGCATQAGTGALDDGRMTAATIVPLVTSAQPAGAVRVDGDRIVIEALVLADRPLAAFVAERAPEERPALLERALR